MKPPYPKIGKKKKNTIDNLYKLSVSRFYAKDCKKIWGGNWTTRIAFLISHGLIDVRGKGYEVNKLRLLYWADHHKCNTCGYVLHKSFYPKNSSKIFGHGHKCKRCVASSRSTVLRCLRSQGIDAPPDALVELKGTLLKIKRQLKKNRN